MKNRSQNEHFYWPKQKGRSAYNRLTRACGGDSSHFFAESLESRRLLSANLVTNGSFEIPLVSSTGMQSYGPNSVNPLVGWTVGGGGLVATLGNSYTYTLPPSTFTFNAADGAASLNLGKSSVGQTITTVAGSSYNVTFSVGNVVDPSGLAFGTDSFVHLFINGKDVYVTGNSAGTTTVNWKQFSFPFTATATSTLIQFVSFDTGHDGYCGLDAVSVFLATAPGQIHFIQQPSDTAAGDTIAPPVTVGVYDSSGAFVTDSTDMITVALAPSADTGTLKGTFTEAAVNGIATFSDLSINQGGNYNLTASDGSGAPVLSSPFKITGDKLVFKPAPADGTANDPLNQIKVELQDGQSNVETTDNSTVITLTPVGFTSANPIKNNTATVVNGIATFSNVILTKPGFYQLQATDAANDAAATSGKFKVTGDKLKFLTPPKPGDINTPIPLTVEILDEKGKLDTTATSSAVLSLNVVSGGVNVQFGGTTAVQFVAGKAIFNATNGPTINAKGTYTFTVTEEDTSTGALAPTNTTTAITSKPPFQVSGFHLAILKQPADTAVNAGLTFSVAIENSKNKIDTTDNSSALSIGFNTLAGGADAQLLGPTVPTVVGGVATFSPTTNVIKFDTIGTYELTATDGVDPLIKFKPIKIQGAHLVFSVKPKPANVNAPLSFTITEEDVHNKVVSTDNSSAIAISVVDSKTGVAAEFTDQASVPPILTSGVLAFGSAQSVSIQQIGQLNLTATAVANAVAGGAVAPLSTIEPVTFKNLKITGFHLAFVQAPPPKAAVDKSILFAVAIKDIHKQTDDTDNTTGLEISVTDTTTKTPALFTEGGGNPVVVFGVMIFDTVPFISISQPGTYTITVSAIVASTAGGFNTPITTIDPVTSKPIKVT